MSVNQEQIINNLPGKIARLKQKYGTEQGAVEIIDTYNDYVANGTTPMELELLWEDVTNYLNVA